MVGIVLMQGVLLAAHWYVYWTLAFFWSGLGAGALEGLGSGLFALAFSFMVAALLSFRFYNPLVTTIYKIAAVWLGFLNFIFWAACLSWAVWLAAPLLGLGAQAAAHRAAISAVLFAVALGAGGYGLANAQWIRVRRLSVKLPRLPENWRGRTALVMSDLHLGHVNGPGFCRRIVALAAGLKPEIVFLPGDVFDGSRIDSDKLAAPLGELRPPFGMYYSTGNHDEFGGAEHFAQVLTRVGIRVVDNERVTADGLHIAGVAYNDSTYPMRLRAFLEGLRLGQDQACILLNHVPNRLPIVEQAGVSLQLSGHTHGGQVFPFTWVTRRAFGKFTYGLQRFGALQVYTSSGAGTWGPPMRVGTHPEVVLMRFE